MSPYLLPGPIMALPACPPARPPACPPARLPARCGTTWACQIVQSLRSGGDMGFEEINLAIPCLEMGHDYGYTDLQAEQGWHPRAFKTHFWRRDCPRGAGKYLFICRGGWGGCGRL